MSRIRAGMTPGERIKALREAAGLTQEQAAGLYGKSVSLWRKYERDERRPRELASWMEIARILRVRDLSQLVGRPVSAMPREPQEHESVSAIRNAMITVISDADPVPGDELGRSVEGLWDVWHAPTPWRYARVGSELPGLIALTAASLKADRRSVSPAACMLYQLTRAYLKRVGARDLSLLAAERAIRCAEDADDPGLAASAAWNMGQILSTQGHTEESRSVAADAARLLERRLSDGGDLLAIFGALHQLCAIQSARLERPDEALRHLDVAADAARTTGETNAYRTAFGPTNVAIHRASVERELSRYGDAIRIAERTDVSAAASVERRVTHHLDLANSYALRRNDVGAVAMLRRAFDASPEELRLNSLARTTVADLVDRETAATSAELRPLARAVGVIE